MKGGRLSSRHKHLGAPLSDINLYVVATKSYFTFLFWGLIKLSIVKLLSYQFCKRLFCVAVIFNVQLTLLAQLIGLTYILIAFQQCIKVSKGAKIRNRYN